MSNYKPNDYKQSNIDRVLAKIDMKIQNLQVEKLMILLQIQLSAENAEQNVDADALEKMYGDNSYILMITK